MRRIVFLLLLLVSALPASRGDAQGVTLFRDRRMRGPSATFHEDVPDLGRTRIGRNRASSIEVAQGCEAILFERTNFRGRRTVFREDDENLANTEVGEDRASSLRVRCRDGRWEPGDDDDVPGDPHGGGRGVRLFRDQDLEGPSELFDRDVPDLSRTRFGANRASSLDVSRGCVAVLYERPGYRGRRATFRERDDDLGNTELGDDRASSLRVRCDGDHHGGGHEGTWGWDEDESVDEPPPYEDVPGPGDHGRGARLFRDKDLEGPSQLFDRDVPDLARTELGRGEASSIDVTPGCIAILFELPGYQGRRTQFRERDKDLGNTEVGDDRASSIQVRCR